jgi:hypothetical protein
MKLAEFQKRTIELDGLLRNRRGHGYNYADLGAVLALIFEAGNGEVAVTQPLDFGGPTVKILTRIYGIDELTDPHIMVVLDSWRDRGQTREGKPQMSQAQADGSAITYARRYALSAIFGLAPMGDDDRAILESKTARSVDYDALAMDQAKVSASKLLEAAGQSIADVANLEPSDDPIEKTRRAKIICKCIDEATSDTDLQYLESIAKAHGLGRPGATIDQRLTLKRRSLNQNQKQENTGN